MLRDDARVAYIVVHVSVAVMPGSTHLIAIAHQSVVAAVLVVDDDPGALETPCALLRHLGMTVFEAATGAEAIAIARAEALDLAILDWRLPHMSGLDVARALRAEHIPVPWVLVSGFMDYDMAVEAGRQGALRAVSSPYDVEDVVLRIPWADRGAASDGLAAGEASLDGQVGRPRRLDRRRDFLEHNCTNAGAIGRSSRIVSLWRKVFVPRPAFGLIGRPSPTVRRHTRLVGRHTRYVRRYTRLVARHTVLVGGTRDWVA